MKRPSFPIHAFLAVLILGPLPAILSCSGGGDAGSGTAVEFSGAWVGTWGSSTPGPSGTLTLQLGQKGAALTGTVKFEGHPCFGTCNVACTVQGEGVSGSFQAGPAQMTVQGFCSEPNRGQGPHHGPGPHHASGLAGTYEILSGPCTGEKGTFNLTPFVAEGAGSPEPGGVYVGEAVLLVTDEGELFQRSLIRYPE